MSIDCPECGAAVELEAEAGDAPWCQDCGHELTADELAAAGGKGKYAGFVVGVILSSEQPSAKDKKYKALQVDVGAEEPLSVVTAAKHADPGDRVVVATVGAVVPAGADADEGTVIQKTSVAGRASHGMLCDAPMLGWKGGAGGVAVKLPDSFAVGSAPPDAKPVTK